MRQDAGKLQTIYKKSKTQHSCNVTESVLARYWGKLQRYVNTYFGDLMSKSRTASTYTSFNSHIAQTAVCINRERYTIYNTKR